MEEEKNLAEENAKLRGIITRYESLFRELDELREECKKLLNEDLNAKVSDEQSVKNLLKKYSRL